MQLTLGGLQSAHTAAVAAACAEQGLRAHLLVRGERPAIPTGYHLLARMFGHVTYITRSEYADRASLLEKYRHILSLEYTGSKVIPEATSLNMIGDALGLLKFHCRRCGL